MPPEEVKQVLHRKLDEVDQQIQQAQEIRRRLQNILQQPGSALLPIHPVEKKILPGQLIASIRFRGPYQALNEKIPLLMQTCAASVCGVPFSLYYDDHPKEDDNEIEICVPVQQAVESGAVHSQTLAGGLALCIIHEGYYDQISLSYQALVNAVHDRQYRILYPIREVYRVGGYKAAHEITSQYQTEIQFLIKE